tara:strand:- start:443 stop:838 length:396 start_codon:yes stop_codon:yes gene_type:complete
MNKLISGLVKPVAKIFTKRQERKMAHEAASAKIKAAKQAGTTEITLGDQEIEALATKGLELSWKDEYVTLSFVSIINLIVIGGIAQGFGYPELLSGMSTAVGAIMLTGVDVSLLMEAVVFSAIGLTIWRKF